MSDYSIRYNRTTNHIAGFEIASTDAYTQNTCGALTRSSPVRSGKTFTTAAEALDAARKLGGRKICKNCERAALAQIARDEIPAVTAVVLPAGVTMNADRSLSGPVKHLIALYESDAAYLNDAGDLILI